MSNTLLNIARTALMTHQKAIDLTGHNIANANTPGYSRQRLELAAAVPLRTPIGTLGRGVSVAGIMSYRDVLLDAAYRREQSAFAHSDTLRSLMGRVEEVFAEPSSVGISAAIDAMFNAFSDLSQSPGSAAARVTVRDAVQQLVNRLHDADGRLSAQQAEISGQITVTVDRINQIGQQVAALNLDIVAASAGGGSAPDLQDARDLLLDELAGLVATRVLPRDDGSVAVIVGDALLVEGAFPQALDVRTVPGGGFAAGIVGSTRNILPGGGVLAALTELSTGGIPGVRSELDRLAAALVGTMN
ncbi:MAG: flagellar hook-associated protein FlgK, partial [Gemmatimonadales bacterium]|nr:flagellar hook-associated protein FlgK [Gemmatimonadales bacterium]